MQQSSAIPPEKVAKERRHAERVDYAHGKRIPPEKDLMLEVRAFDAEVDAQVALSDLGEGDALKGRECLRDTAGVDEKDDLLLSGESHSTVSREAWQLASQSEWLESLVAALTRKMRL